MKFADPQNDIAFKKIFGNADHQEVLISFLNSVLDFQNDDEIAQVTLVNPYQLPAIEELKETLLDVKAVNQRGEEFIVEMQKKDHQDFHKRSLYYTAKSYTFQLDKGENYDELKKVYFIGILNFQFFSNKHYISRHLILNKETQIQELEDFEFAFLELSKFNKALPEVSTILDKWAYFLKYAQKLEYMPTELIDQPELKTAFEIALQHNWDKKEMEIYEYIEKKERDEISVRQTSIDKANKEGEEKGIKKGRAEGLVEGEEKGKIKEKYKTARTMKAEGFEPAIIAKVTGLSIEEIEQLED